MTDFATPGDPLTILSDSAAIPGDLVRDLVAGKEQEITALLGELELALRDAAEAERRLADHPSASLVADLADEDDAVPAEAGMPQTTDGAATTGERPRTTVVSRPRIAQTGTDDSAASTSNPASDRPSTVEPGEDSGRWSTLVTSHLVLKVGIVITLVALALLKFG
jgi:hypothetical protein